MASLDQLPNELLSLIASHLDNDQKIKVFSSLSRTCKRLRSFALPVCWKNVRINSISQLGRLHEVLIASPDIAPHVQGFFFHWNMGGDFDEYEEYPEEEGTLLDMAFRDRNKMWLDLASKHGCKVMRAYQDVGVEERVRSRYRYLHQPEYYMPDHQQPAREEAADAEQSPGEDDDSTTATQQERETDEEYDRVISELRGSAYSSYRHYFFHDDVRFLQPGRAPYWDPLQRKLTDMSGMTLRASSKQFVISGPDGHGEDARIKSASEFGKCMTEIVERLTRLHIFSWDTHVTTIPVATFAALQRLSTLRGFIVYLSGYRGNVHVLPLWNLSPLVTLSIRSYPPPPLIRLETPEGHQEEDFTSFELPLVRPSTVKARHDLHAAIACRMIIAAARGDCLIYLEGTLGVQAPFAMRSLLPMWVFLKTLWISRRAGWQAAAACFRPLLAHASLWLGTTAHSGARDDRKLTAQEIQGLQHYFQDNEIPEFVQPEIDGRQPVERYLPWLEEDLGLAEEVAHSWQTALASGELDECMCICSQCMLSS